MRYEGESGSEGVPARIGDIVDGCKIIEIAGAGAMCYVYRAFEIDLEIERALKMLRPEMPAAVRRKFGAEGKITARLDHPHIVKVHGSGIWNDRHPYIKMEYIDGKSLRHILSARRHVPPAAALALTAVLAKALDYAARQTFTIWGATHEGVVHRDLKPENILITRQGTPKIADFGIVQTDDDAGRAAMGTTAYMSPEQHADSELTFASDIYALGILLYEMICGVRPFPDDPARIAEAKQRASYAPVQEHAPSVPPEVREIVDRCLAPDPKKRYTEHDSLQFACERALETYGPLSPAELIQAYIIAPDQFKSRLHAARKATQAKRSYAKPWLIAVGALAVLGGAWFVASTDFVKFDLSKLFRDYESEAGDRRAALENERNDAPAIAHAPEDRESGDGHSAQRNAAHKQPEKGSPFPARAQRPETASHAGDPRHSAALPQPDAAKPSSEKSPKPAESASPPADETSGGLPPRGKKAYFERDYRETIRILAPALTQITHKPARDSAVTMLMEARYMTSDFSGAVALANKYDTKTARSRMIQALVFEALDNHERAAHLFDTSVRAPTLFGDRSAAEALLQRARYYQRQFEKKKDDATRMNMIHAWRDVERGLCGIDTSACETARSLLRRYEGVSP
jgi:serine/threonine protein kinase